MAEAFASLSYREIIKNPRVSRYVDAGK